MMETIMKSLIALLLAVLTLFATPASALCLYITDSYSGIIPPEEEITAHGPFAITSANGCYGASIDAMVTVGGAGRTPGIFIEREVGGTWKKETFSIGSNASYSGPFGNYRVRLKNNEAVPKSYSGTIRYGR